MQISNNPSPSFGAIKVKNAEVIRCIPELQSVKGVLFEFKADSKQDLKTLEEVNRLWAGNNFIDNLYLTLSDLNVDRNGIRKQGYKIYGITTQTKRFGKLDPEQIASLAEIQELSTGEAKILYLESKPLNMLNGFKKEFKSTGKRLIACLQDNMYKKLTLWAERKSLVPYYESCNFKSIQSDSQHMEWVL